MGSGSGLCSELGTSHVALMGEREIEGALSDDLIREFIDGPAGDRRSAEEEDHRGQENDPGKNESDFSPGSSHGGYSFSWRTLAEPRSGQGPTVTSTCITPKPSTCRPAESTRTSQAEQRFPALVASRRLQSPAATRAKEGVASGPCQLPA